MSTLQSSRDFGDSYAATRRARPLARWCVLIAVALVPLDSIAVTVGPVPIRAYMLPGVLVIVGGLGLRVNGPRSFLIGALSVNTALVLLSALWTLSLTDTLATGLGQFYLLLLIIAILRTCNAGIVSVEDFKGALLAGVAISAVVALFQVGLYLGLGINIGVWTDMTNVPWPRPDGLTREPIWAAVNATVGLGLSIDRVFSSFVRKSGALLLFLAVIALTFSRAAILPLLALGIVVVVIFLVRQFRINPRVSGTNALILVSFTALIVTFAVQFLPDSVFARFNLVGALGSDNASVDQGSLNSRLGVQQLILDQWQSSPVIGHGAGSIAIAVSDPTNQLIYAGGGELNTGRGSTNLELTMLWDLGVLGAASITVIVLYMLVAAILLGRLSPGLMFATVSLLIQYQLSNGYRLGITWMVIAWLVMLVQRRGTRSAMVKGDGTDRYVQHGGPASLHWGSGKVRRGPL